MHCEYGWASLLLFYSALHLVEAYRYRHHPHKVFRDHADRNEYVSVELPTLRDAYRTLRSISVSIRYDMLDCKERNYEFVLDYYDSVRDGMQSLGIS